MANFLLMFAALGAAHCEGSARYDACVNWFVQCMSNRYVMEEWRGVELEEEVCAENIPPWATEGM